MDRFRLDLKFALIGLAASAVLYVLQSFFY